MLFQTFQKYKAAVLVSILIGALTAVSLNLWDQRTRNRALTLKLNILSKENKRKVKPWTIIKNKPETVLTEEPSKGEIPNALPSKSEAIVDLSQWPAKKLASELERRVQTRSELTQEELEQSLRMADEIIAKEQNSYSAYKAKLILLLTEESTHNQNVDDDEINRILYEMSTFDIADDRTAQKEAFLISKTNSEIDKLEDQYEQFEEDLIELEDQSISLEEDDSVSDEEFDDESDQIAIGQEEIEKKLDNITEKIEELEDQTEDGVLADADYINEDIVEIPLQRGLAKGNYDQVIEEAQAILDEFPDSTLAYFYQVRALELSGRPDEALDVIENMDLNPEESEQLRRRLMRDRKNNPKDYWKRLNF